MRSATIVWSSFILTAACSSATPPQPGSQGTSSSNAAIGVGSRRQHQQVVERRDIVSDRPGALAQDTDLINAWGLAFNPRGVAWVSANGSGLAAVYNEAGQHVIPSVTIPVPNGGTPPSTPTGQVFNGDTSAFKGDLFIFVTEDGTISGWQPSDGSTAMLRVDNSASGAVYKGVTIAKTAASQSMLFAANFHGGTVEAFDANYAPTSTSGGFMDADIPAGFAPFNVQEVGGNLVVTYALQDADAHDDVAGPGNGFVDLYDTNGGLIARLISRDDLNSPWGVTMTPANFGSIPHRLLIGDFGDGAINVYLLTGTGKVTRAMHEGALVDDNGNPLVIEGLWALKFGPGAGGFDKNNLYFTAGPDDESHGVFGQLELPH